MSRKLPASWATLMDQRKLTSIRRLADAANVSHPAVARLIHRDGTPSDVTIMAVAKALDVEPAVIYWMAGIGAPPAAGPWVPPDVAARLTERQRAALNELVRAMVEPADAVVDVEYTHDLAARHSMDEDRKNRS